MEAAWTSDGVTLYAGDCIEVMAAMEADSVDAIVTDPPYGLEFMGRNWDSFGTDTGNGYQEKPRWGGKGDETSDRRSQMVVPNFYTAGKPFQRWCEQWASEALRVLKPGGHMLCFGGTRTFHRLTSGIEDAGFEIRDCVMWLYGQGFPKSLNVSKAIDRHLGAEREVVGTKKKLESYGPNEVYGSGPDHGGMQAVTAPATPEAAQWEGWGTALKPGWEPVIVARKPIEQSVAFNVLRYGTGAMNIDGCRIEGIKDVPASVSGVTNSVYGDMSADRSGSGFDPLTGRWPVNLILSHSPGCEPLGTKTVRGSKTKPASPVPEGNRAAYGRGLDGARPERGIGDEDGNEQVTVWRCTEECPVAELNRQSGVRPAGSPLAGSEPSMRMGSHGIYGTAGPRSVWAGYRDTGGASRFFPVFRYEPKATSSERPRIWTPDCDCETIKPSSQPGDTAGSQSDDGSSWSTSGSGSRRTSNPSLRDMTSTTETETSSTTTSPTFSSSPSWSTSESTRDASCETASGGSPAESAGNSSPSPSSTGTSPLRAGSPTDDAAPVISRVSSKPGNCAVCGTPYRSEMHATVKPVDLMEWLVRLVTPPGGTCLDPFAGSGSTAEACIVGQFDVILIEKDETYLELIKRRLTKPIQSGLF